MKAATAERRVVGDGMVGKAVCVKQGGLSGTRTVFTHLRCRRAGRAGVRAPIGARKRGNARRAKGGRKVDA